MATLQTTKNAALSAALHPFFSPQDLLPQFLCVAAFQFQIPEEPSDGGGLLVFHGGESERSTTVKLM